MYRFDDDAKLVKRRASAEWKGAAARAVIGEGLLPMRRVATAICLGWITILSITPAFGGNDKRLKKEIKSLYAKQIAVGKTRDVKAMMEFNTMDYSVKLLNGNKLSRQQLEQGMTRYFASGQLVRQINFSYKILGITPSSDEVIVLVEQRDKRIQIRRDGKPHQVEANVIHRDTWIKTPDGWKRNLTEEIKQTKFTVDGKPVQP